MDRQHYIRTIVSILERNCFSVAYVERLRSCFDIMAEKGGRILIIKFVKNIDAVTAAEANALKKLAGFFGAETFIVGVFRKSLKLESGVRFSRHGIPCMSIDSIDTVIFRKRLAIAERFIGAKYMVDRDVIRKLRQISGLSIKRFAAETKISKDSIYRYEKGGAYATYSNLHKLENFFYEAVSEKSRIEPVWTDDQKTEVIMDHVGHSLLFMRIEAAPFEMVGKGRFRYEAGRQTNQRTMVKWSILYSEIADILKNDYPFFIAEGKNSPKRVGRIPSVSRSELGSVGNEEELIALVSANMK
jgi:predicted transcriptional regulator